MYREALNKTTKVYICHNAAPYKSKKMEGEGNVSHAKKEKEKTNDPVKLRMKVEKLDAKIDALKAKKEEIIKQLYDLEGAGS
ncbi:hypothetical protein ZIOFF_032941 [Zingiber officinale]|uniref:Uncharacterized protein n=1 Tax=Zingiber officinale TaxID=94328 RepID=A0A8J5LBX6_ZINOF|nr:hypothetical protein ZIOFF_032941 [Zingiber officinale]